MTFDEMSELWRHRGYQAVLYNMPPDPPWVELYESRWGDPAPRVWEGHDAVEQAARAAEKMNGPVLIEEPRGPAVPVEVAIEWDMACHCYVVACLTYDIVAQGPPGGRPGAALESLETAMRLLVEDNGPLKPTTESRGDLLADWGDPQIWDMFWFPETKHLRFTDGRGWQSQRSVSR